MYITAITQNLSKKCCMQYLSPLFNYTGYKNKISILHPSGSLPTEGTLNPSSDPLSLAHPSPVFPHWLGWRTEPLEHGIPLGQQVSAMRPQPWGAIPASLVLQGTVGKSWSEGPRAAGMAGSGRMVSAAQGPLLGTAGLSVAENSFSARVRAAAGPAPGWLQGPGCWARVQEVLGLEQLWQREHRCHTSVFGHAGPGSPNWSPRVCQVLDSATGPQALCSLGCAAQHPSVLHLRFLESRNKETNICLRGREHVQLQFWGF